MDLTHCTNLRILHIGTIIPDGFSGSGERIRSLLAAIWATLSQLAPNALFLEDIVFIFGPLEDAESELENFEWMNFIGKVQGMFQNLKAVTIGVGRYVRGKQSEDLLLSAVRRAPGVRKLEEKGSVLLRTFPWDMFGAVCAFLLLRYAL